MSKCLEKIKNFLSGKFVWWPKKKEEPKPQEEELKAQEKPKEQK